MSELFDIAVVEDVWGEPFVRLAAAYALRREPDAHADPQRVTDLAIRSRVLVVRNRTAVDDVLLRKASGQLGLVARAPFLGSGPGSFELAYPEDLGGGEILSLLEERKALSGLHHILETPALVKKAVEAERQGFDAVIQSNTFDPGVEASRLAVRIPVVGLLRASLHFAASIADRFGLIVPLETHMPHTMRLVQAYGMSAFVSGIRTVGLYDTGDLSGYHDTVVERTLAVGKELVSQGAQAIIPRWNHALASVGSVRTRASRLASTRWESAT